jgi:hypothetical protein
MSATARNASETQPNTPTAVALRGAEATYAYAENEADRLTTKVRKIRTGFDAELVALNERINAATAPTEAELSTAIKLVEETGEALRNARAANERAVWAQRIPTTAKEVKAWLEAYADETGVGVRHAWNLSNVVKTPDVGSKLTLVGVNDANEVRENAATEKLYLAFRRKSPTVLVGWLHLSIDGHRGGSTYGSGLVNGQPYLRDAEYSRDEDGKRVFRRAPVRDVSDVKEPLAQFLAALGKGSLNLAPRPEECDHTGGASGELLPSGDVRWTCSRCRGVVTPGPGSCAECGNLVVDTLDYEGKRHGYAYTEAQRARIADHKAIKSTGPHRLVDAKLAPGKVA